MIPNHKNAFSLTELRRHFPLLDALWLAVLFTIAWATAGFLWRDDLFIFGDHPGQYWRMWYTLNVSWPLRHRVIDWIPYWYAGYPELQFYPLGFVIVGWLLNLITFGRISTALIYEIVVFIAYALPGFTFYYAVRHLGFDRRAAFAAGLFGLIFPAIFGGAGAPFIGMIGSRLAFGLNPLVFVWAIDVLEGRGTRYGWLATLALALALLAHPYHEIGMMLALGFYILIRRLPPIRTSTRLLALVFFATALDAFWLAPLLAHSSTEMITYIRATFDQTWRQLTDESLWPYVLFALPALIRAWREQDSRHRAILVVFLTLAIAVSAAMLSIYVILIERLRFYGLDPVRLIGEFYFPLIFLAAMGVSELGTWVSKIVEFKTLKMRTLPAGAVTLLLSAFLLIRFFQTHAYYYPKENDEPRFLSQALADYRLDELWEVLRASEGRILFTSFYTHLSARGTEPFPTTLPALTPSFTQRQIMGGTFSHWSPITALMWVGQINPPVLWGRIEEQDDRALFGTPLEELSDAQLYNYCQRFNITTIVASINDFLTRTFLDASPHFQSYYNNGFFFVYRVKGYDNTWIDPRKAIVDLTTFTDQEITFRVRAARSNASVGVKVYAYPLWRAYTDDGQSLQIMRDDLGLMRILLPRGENYSVTLRYEDGPAEQIGTLISVFSLALFLSVGVYAVRK